MAVHMDNEHTLLTDENIFDLVRRALKDPDDPENQLGGCGYAGMLRNPKNPLGLSERALEHFKSINIIPKMIRKGSRLAELDGFHADKAKGHAYAITNMKEGTTLDHHLLKEKGLQVYGHDPHAADTILKHMEEILREKGQNDWADNLHENGVKIERDHHRIAAVALAGMEPEEIY